MPLKQPPHDEKVEQKAETLEPDWESRREAPAHGEEQMKPWIELALAKPRMQALKQEKQGRL